MSRNSDTKEVYKRILDLRELSKNEGKIYFMGKLEGLNMPRRIDVETGSELSTSTVTLANQCARKPLVRTVVTNSVVV